MSFKNLLDISTLVTNYTKKSRFAGMQEDQSTLKYMQLIEGLGSKNWRNEDDAVQDIYGKSLGSKTFGMLKTRAKERLVNMIFQLDTQKRFKSSYDKAYYSACKNLVAGVILLIQNKPNSGNECLKLTLGITKKYHFNDLAIVALRLLRYAKSVTGSEKGFRNYDRQLKNTLKTIENELISEELNQELIMEVVRSAAPKEELAERVKDYFSKIKDIVKQYDTYTTRLNMYRVGLRYYDWISDYREMIRLATECENYLKSNPHLIQKVRLGEMNLHKLYSSLHLRDYRNGTKYADSCRTLFNPGTLNWLIFLEYYFLLCLHTSNYKEAWEIYNQVISHPTFQNYNPQSKEKWKIFEAFLSYAYPGPVTRKQFNVHRFTNDVPMFSKDKAGYNLSIIIAQIILLLKTGDYNRILDRYEALKVYAGRYIRKERNPRSYYFIKMLLVMVKYDFDAKKTEQIANKFFMKLKQASPETQSELETLEVIPYDLLWPEIIRQLEKNKSAA